MPTATVTSKGQITIPKEIRACLGLKAGDRVVFQTIRDGVVEMRPRTLDLRSLAGMIDQRGKGVTLEQMEAAIVDGGCHSGLPEATR